MEPQNTETQPPQTPKPQPAVNKAKKPVLLVMVLFLLLAVMGAGAFYANTLVRSKDKELHSTKQELSSVKVELSKAQTKLNQLDNPIMKANNEQRKADLASFTALIRQYKTENRTYPSTFPSSFKKDFVDVYVTPKLPNFIDPNTKEKYLLVPVAQVQTPPGLPLGTIQYQWAGECAGSEFKDTPDDSKAAARILLETGETYCLNV